MASIYTRKKSPYFWVKYRNSTGKLIRESTKLLVKSSTGHRRARVIAAEKSLEEANSWRAVVHRHGSWDVWVMPWIQVRYCTCKATELRYTTCWKNLSAYLRDRGIGYPCQLSYEQCIDYVGWRSKRNAAAGTRQVKRNTALTELKLLHLVMWEAIRRGFAVSNPVARLGLAREPVREKPVFTSAQIDLVRDALKKEPAWMRTCFEISYHTGCRLMETRVAVTNIDLAARTIFFAAPKGGASRAFQAPISDGLFQVLKPIVDSGASHTLEWPANILPGKAWHLFFRKVGLPGHCFHSLRVTFITAGSTSGVPERDMMRLVNHASKAVHRTYQRLSGADLALRRAQIVLPGSATAQNFDSPSATGAPH